METGADESRHPNRRRTPVTKLAESGAGDQTIMDIARHVSRQMLARYSHIRMEAKWKALEGIVSKQRRKQQQLLMFDTKD